MSPMSNVTIVESFISGSARTGCRVRSGGNKRTTAHADTTNKSVSAANARPTWSLMTPSSAVPNGGAGLLPPGGRSDDAGHRLREAPRSCASSSRQHQLAAPDSFKALENQVSPSRSHVRLSGLLPMQNTIGRCRMARGSRRFTNPLAAPCSQSSSRPEEVHGGPCDSYRVGVAVLLFPHQRRRGDPFVRSLRAGAVLLYTANWCREARFSKRSS